MRSIGKSFIKILMPYLIVLIFLLIMSLSIHFVTINVIKANTQQLCLASLEQKVSRFDAILSGLEEYIYQYSKCEYIDTMISADLQNTMDIGTVMNINKPVPNYTSFNTSTRNYVTQIITFFTNSGVVLMYPNIYYSSKWSKDFTISGITIQEWMELIDTNEKRTLFETSLDGTKDLLIYKSELPLGYAESNSTVMLLFIDREKLERQLLANLDFSDTAAYVKDSSDNILFSSINGYISEDMSVASDLPAETADIVEFQIQSAYNDWTYVWRIPSSQVNAQMNHIISTVFMIMLLLLLIGIGVSYAMAYRQNRPIKEIIGIMSSSVAETEKSANDEYDWIKSNIRILVDHSKSLQIQLLQNRNIVKATVLDQLLDGSLSVLSSSDDVISRIDFPQSTVGYTVIVLQIKRNMPHLESIADIRMQRSVLISLLREDFPEILIHEVEYHRVAVFYCPEGNHGHTVMEFTDKLLQIFEIKEYTNVVIGVGNTCLDIMRIKESYKSAVYALAVCKNETVIIFSDAYHEEALNMLYYPIEAEQRIINHVRAGDTAETHALLEQLYIQNTSYNVHSDFIVNVFLSNVIATIYKTLSLDEMEKLQQFDCRLTDFMLQEITGGISFQNVLEIYETICAFFNCNRQDSANLLIRQVAEYIETYYMDQNISLCWLAEKFGLSETYLSRLYKEQAGENFSRCLERIRINKAHMLLTETTMTIDEIAYKIGYSSADTFRKAFKRFHSVSPVVYRATTRG